MSTDWIASLQRNSNEVNTIILKLDETDTTVMNKYEVEDGSLYRTTKGRWRLYLSDELRYDIVYIGHIVNCHI